MSTSRKLTIAVAAVVVLVVAFVVLRPDDDNESSPTADATTQVATTPGPATTTVTESAGTPEDADQPRTQPTAPPVRRIRVRGGQPVGGARSIEVERGDRVRLAVTADAPEEVHLHGYDVSRDVGPGKTARFDFRADAEGVFEMELEHSAVKIADLEVRPR